MKRRRLPRERLGDILQHSGLIDREQLGKALDRQQAQTGLLGSHLLSLGYVEEDDLARALSVQHHTPPYLTSHTQPDPAAAGKLPREIAHRLQAAPFAWDEAQAALSIAVANPADLAGLDEIRFASGARRVVVQVAAEAVVDRLLAHVYDGAPAQEPQGIQVSLGAPLQVPAGQPTDRPKARGRVAIVDPDGRRQRAMAALFESCGFSARRIRDPGGLSELQRREPSLQLWVHDSLEFDENAPGVVPYSDPIELLRAGALAGAALAPEARACAEQALALSDPTAAAEASRAAGLIRWLARRQELGGVEVETLVVRGYRAALEQWQAAPALGRAAGDDILQAVVVYQRALYNGAGRSEAAEAVRQDASLSASVVTSLLRWTMGTDLLQQMDSGMQLLSVFAAAEQPEELLGQLTTSGWQVQRAATVPQEGTWDVVLADLPRGLELLDKTPTGGAALPPLFLLSEQPSGPDTMYALRLGAEDVLSRNTHAEVIETKLARAARRGKPATGMVHGSLTDLSLAELLQILSNGIKTACVRVQRDGETGEVYVSAGRIVDACSGDQAGEEALYRLMCWEQGTFRVESGSFQRQETIQDSTEGLLMEGYRRLDEQIRDEAVPEP